MAIEIDVSIRGNLAHISLWGKKGFVIEINEACFLSEDADANYAAVKLTIAIIILDVSVRSSINFMPYMLRGDVLKKDYFADFWLETAAVYLRAAGVKVSPWGGITTVALLDGHVILAEVRVLRPEKRLYFPFLEILGRMPVGEAV